MERIIKKVILVGFDKGLLIDDLYGFNLHKNIFIHKTDKCIHLNEYAYYITQLYKNNGVFFDNIFKSIEEGIKENDNIQNRMKNRTSGVIDCYPLLHKRINHLLKNDRGCLIISKIGHNRYDYLLDLINVNKVYLSTEMEVKNYLKGLNSKFIKN